MGINSRSLRKKSKLSGSTSLEDLKLGGNVLLQIHGPGHTILREHSTRGLLYVLQLGGGSVLPAVNSLQGVVKVDEGGAEVLNDLDGVLETANNLKLSLNSLDLLVNNLLLVLGKGDGHASEVVVDGLEESADALVAKVLPLLHVSKGCLKVVHLLHLLDLLLGSLELRGNSLVVLSIANPGLLGVLEQLQSVLGLLLGVIPAFLDPLDIALKELGLVRVFQDNLTLGNEINNN